MICIIIPKEIEKIIEKEIEEIVMNDDVNVKLKEDYQHASREADELDSNNQSIQKQIDEYALRIRKVEEEMQNQEKYEHEYNELCGRLEPEQTEMKYGEMYEVWNSQVETAQECETEIKNITDEEDLDGLEHQIKMLVAENTRLEGVLKDKETLINASILSPNKRYSVIDERTEVDTVGRLSHVIQHNTIVSSLPQQNQSQSRMSQPRADPTTPQFEHRASSINKPQGRVVESRLLTNQLSGSSRNIQSDAHKKVEGLFKLEMWLVLYQIIISKHIWQVLTGSCKPFRLKVKNEQQGATDGEWMRCEKECFHYFTNHNL